MVVYSLLFVFLLAFVSDAVAFHSTQHARLMRGVSHTPISVISSPLSQRVSSLSLFLQSDKDSSYLSSSKLWNSDDTTTEEKEETAFDKVASKGLAGVLAIAVAESIFWALGVPLAALWYKYTTGEWIDMMTTDGQLKAAGFSFGYGGFATAILQYRVTLFAIPLVPVMENLVVKPGKKFFGEKWGEQSAGDPGPGSRGASPKVCTIIGATSGVGQLVANRLNPPSPPPSTTTTSSGSKYLVRAVSRNIESAARFELISHCDFIQADARDFSTLPPAIDGCDVVIISVGTTAFPTSKWEEGKNDPRAACYETVLNILDTIERTPVGRRPTRVILLSSIGVLRQTQFPFSFLNSYKVLEYKLQSEDLLQRRCDAMGIDSIVIRPGRLVGPPFTNFDLAKLFGVTIGDKRKVVLSLQDDVQGDTDRGDVADVVIGLLEADIDGNADIDVGIDGTQGVEGMQNSKRHKRFSMVNSEGTMEGGEWQEKMLEIGITDFEAPSSTISREVVDV